MAKETVIDTQTGEMTEVETEKVSVVTKGKNAVKSFVEKPIVKKVGKIVLATGLAVGSFMAGNAIAHRNDEMEFDFDPETSEDVTVTEF